MTQLKVEESLMPLRKRTDTSNDTEVRHELYVPLTVGCDPEFHLVDKGGEPVSAHDIVPGTKQDPYWFDHGLGSVQADGTAVEIGIKPARTPSEFVHNVETTMQSVRAMVDDKYIFSFKDHHVFKREAWDRLPASAKEIGCSPDYNSYSGDIRMPPAREPYTVYLGGHVHFGWRDPNAPALEFLQPKLLLLEAMRVCYYMNAFFSHLVNTAGPRRRRHYDDTMRPKPYGVEWRSLPGGWLGYTHGELLDFATCLFETFDSARTNEHFVYGGHRKYWPIETRDNSSGITYSHAGVAYCDDEVIYGNHIRKGVQFSKMMNKLQARTFRKFYPNKSGGGKMLQVLEPEAPGAIGVLGRRKALMLEEREEGCTPVGDIVLLGKAGSRASRTMESGAKVTLTIEEDERDAG